MYSCTIFKPSSITIDNDFTNLMRQISISMTDALEDGIRKCATNTAKKYMVYNIDVEDGKGYVRFELFDADEKLCKGTMIDLDEVREYLKERG